MTKFALTKVRRYSFHAALLATTLLAAVPAHAQLTTATIRGQVTTSGAAAPGSAVIAVNAENGSTVRATAGPDGSYVLSGLRTGPYTITIAPVGGTAITRQVVVSVGQTTTLDVDTATNTAGAADDPGLADSGQATGAEGGTIVVVGRRLVEMRTSEVGTNITDDQIENLPQGSRNFLNMAALAPGIRIIQDPKGLRQTFGGAGVGQDPNGEAGGGPQVNVFIDGVSLKSNIQQGGVVGQDVSGGNPFSQLAVREFRVLTSNFKAEYEDAGTAIITAVTKSGTNSFKGEAFGLFQNQGLIAKDYFQKKNDLDEPKRKRVQYGASFGGPIIQNDLFFFGSLEVNNQDRGYNVVPGPIPADQIDLIDIDPSAYAGTYTSPFREKLGFGKLTWQAADNQLVELSGSVRVEDDLRDFGGTVARERGTTVDNNVYTTKLRYDYSGNGWLNEATVDFLRYDLDFGPDQEAGFGRAYADVITIGGRPTFQKIRQEGLTFRNNFSLTDVQWNGDHLIKAGFKISRQKYRVGGSGPNAVPEFLYFRNAFENLDFSAPALVLFGRGDPNVRASTTQIGLFVQDDWEVNEHLLVNLGLRWDIDTNAKNNSFETPDRAVEALRALEADPRTPDFFDVDDYISDGNRKAESGNFAPRIGLSYDINADQRTVLFAGYGRYYDRAIFRNAAEETLYSQYQRGEILFSQDGEDRNGRPTILWDPVYLTEAGFEGLIADLDAQTFGWGELRLIPNDLKTPFTDQYSIGIRQRFGPVRATLTLNQTIGKNQIGYAPLNRTELQPNGFYDYIGMINGYGDAIAAFNTRRSKYNAVLVSIDKPYSEQSGWGFGVAYTYAKSKERGAGGGGGFNFDYPNIAEQPYWPNAGDERHRLVLNGIVDLPFGIRASSIATYASGFPFRVFDAREGWDREHLRIGHFRHSPDFLQVDLRLQKIVQLMGNEVAFSAEVFNLFNRANFGPGGDKFVGPGEEINWSKTELSGPSRSFQFGTTFKF